MPFPYSSKRLARPLTFTSGTLGCALIAVLMAAPATAQDQGQSPMSGSHPIFGPNSRQFQGPNYNLLRPGPPMAGMHRMYGPPVAYPRTGIFGEHSRYYGGADYHHLRPGGPYGPGPMGPVQMYPETGIFGRDSYMYGGPSYDNLR